jgi:galactarate dehydratase
LSRQIDINAGHIATAEATIPQVGEQIFEMILEVARGRKRTWGDHWGLHNESALFNPAPNT